MDPKQVAAEQALKFVRGVRVLGLGTGKTAEYFIQALAGRYQARPWSDFVTIPTSVRTEQLARRLGLPLSTLEAHPQIDLTVDGADEVDPQLNLIKGLGGALTREKIVATASRQFIVIVDDSKLVERFRGPLPVEVLPFGWKRVQKELIKLGAEPKLRELQGKPFVTDEGNYVLDCQFRDGIEDPPALDRTLNDIPGLVEHGLFLEMADRVIVGSASGVQILEH